MRKLVIGKNDAGQRLDKFLSKAVKGLPMSLMYKDIRTKRIKLNGKRAKENQILAQGDEITLFIRDEFFESPEKDTVALCAIKPKLFSCEFFALLIAAIPAPRAIINGTVIGPVVTPPESKAVGTKSPATKNERMITIP